MDQTVIERTQAQTTNTRAHGHSFAFAYGSLLVFVFIYFARPEDWIPGLGGMRPALVAGTLATAGFVLAALGSGAGILALPRGIWYLIALFFQLFAAAVFSPVWRGGAFQVVVFTFSKIVLIAIVIAIAVTTLERLRKLIFIQASSFALVAIVSIVESRKIAGRLMGSLNGIYANPNDLAFAIALGFPLCWIFLHRTPSKIKKLMWLSCMGAMAYAVFMTASRSGLIVLSVSVLISLWEFGFKGGRRHLLVIGTVVALGIVIIAPKKMMDTRFDAFSNRSASGSAYDSYQQRHELLVTSLRVTGEHPLFGVGPGNFQVVSGNWHVAHNSLAELSAEGGIVALLLFLLMVKSSFSNLRRAREYDKDHEELTLWRSGLKVALITLLVGSLFSSIEYQFFPYMLMAYTAALQKIASEHEVREAQPDAARAVVGISRSGLRFPEEAGPVATIGAK
ncbi:MAG TPA: O-antigen ligase family protein [Terriglobia bacterium]|nr:O-antigen ligase family protein [Terriglobia bacterium]